MLIKILEEEKNGQALIELLVGFAILTIVLTSVTFLVIGAREARTRAANILEAENSLVFQNEALRSVRESGWSNLQNGTYHLVSVGGAWTLVPNSETVDGFERQIVIDDTCRDPSGNLVDCPSGTTDPSTKKLTSSVSWQHFFGGKVEDTFYFTRHLNNDTWVQSTQSQFDQGTLINTQSTLLGDGEVQLLPGGDWATPLVVETYNAPGGANGQDVFIQGDFAYLVRSDGGEDEFVVLNVKNPRDVQFLGSVDLDATGFSVFVKDSYAYVATSNDNRELAVIDISDKSNPTITGPGYDTPGNGSGRGVHVVGNTAYLVKQGGGDDFFSLDITNSPAISLLDSLNLAGSGFDVNVSGIYAYVASNNNNQELQVINVSDPNNISPAGDYNTPGRANGSGVFVLGSTVYLTTRNSANEFFILDATDPADITETGSTDLGRNGLGVFVQGSLAFVTSNNGNDEFQAIDISTPSNPSVISTLDLNGTGNGFVVIGDYAFVTSNNNSAELQVIFGGDGSNFVTSGTFESQTFNAGSNSGFNFMDWTVDLPAGTSVQLKIQTSNTDGLWNSFVGPDGSPSSFYDSLSAFPLSQVSAQYFRFKAFLSGDSSVTPSLQDGTVNYSP